MASGTASASNTNHSRKALPPPAYASNLTFANAPEKKLYWDRSHYDSPATQVRALARSKTLYVGNLAFSTRGHHLLAMFSSIGRVVSINMGVDRYKKTPCGFGFVEYERRQEALQAVSYLSGSRLDGRPIRVELDAGFKPGRQYGRGVSGGQVRDDRRTTVDPARSKGAPRRPAKWEAPMSGKKRGREDDDVAMMQSSAKNLKME